MSLHPSFLKSHRLFNVFPFGPKPLFTQVAPGVLRWVLIATFAASVVGWILYFTQQASPPLQARHITPPAPTQLAATLFGSANESSIQLNLKVLGVVIAENKTSNHASSRALISVDGQPPQVFYLGQIVAEGAALSSVSAQTITLRRDNVEASYAVPQLTQPADLIQTHAAR